MTGPIADQQVNAHLGGTDPTTGGVLSYQAVPILARTIYSNYDGRQPYYTNYGKGPVANSAATYDAVTGTALQTATRFVDPYGEVGELHKLVKLLWYWLMDGAPTGMGALGTATNRIPTYIALANQLRPWPVGFTGAAAGEPTKAYPAFPPSAPTTLDSFMSTVSTKHAAAAQSAYHGVEPVVHHPKPQSAQRNWEQVLNRLNVSAVPQFTDGAGPEHYAAAGGLHPIPVEHRLPPGDNTMKTFAPQPVTLDELLQQIMQRLDRLDGGQR